MLFYLSLVLLAFLLAPPRAKEARGPWRWRQMRHRQEGVLGGEAEDPFHLLSLKVGTLRVQGPKGPREFLHSLGEHRNSMKWLFLGSILSLFPALPGNASN